MMKVAHQSSSPTRDRQNSLPLAGMYGEVAGLPGKEHRAVLRIHLLVRSYNAPSLSATKIYEILFSGTTPCIFMGGLEYISGSAQCV
jgi:hypothetical protein